MDAEVFASLASMSSDGRVMGIRVRQGKTRVWVEVPVAADERDNMTWASADNTERRTRAIMLRAERDARATGGKKASA
jgi:hypothetical protein